MGDLRVPPPPPLPPLLYETPLKVIYNVVCYFSCTVSISNRLLHAIRRVETGGEADPLTAVGDNGASLGPYQISEAYYNDAVEQTSSLQDNGRTYQNVRGAGSCAYSEMVIQAYMDRYATAAILGRTATEEDIARIHDGGPNGYQEESTVSFWNLVQPMLVNHGRPCTSQCMSRCVNPAP